MGMPLDKRALDFGLTGNKINASSIPVNTTAFNKNLTASETTVQLCMDKIDDLSASSTVVPNTIDLTFNGTDTQKDVTVSAKTTDARKAQWALHDNANNYERIFCKITATSASNVRINTNIALTSGTYRLIGLEDIS